ncbi:MAG: methyltransferase domain-containing protein [Planctomycetota bacterium]|nr:methyltransferase domain-containing protein [Planctomycetaceae bacterium]MDQ3330334.1 methyltransferase domain-containing protein [Planctomycetota bacterium]
MLDRAAERIGLATAGRVTAIQGDVREIDLGEGRFDIILAAAVLHHLRSDAEWRQVFAAFHRVLRPGGSLWIFDLVDCEMPAVRHIVWRRYGKYLADLKDETYRNEVLAYIEKEDAPRPLAFQLELLRQVGFDQIDVLHTHTCFAAFGATRTG